MFNRFKSYCFRAYCFAFCAAVFFCWKFITEKNMKNILSVLFLSIQFQQPCAFQMGSNELSFYTNYHQWTYVYFLLFSLSRVSVCVHFNFPPFFQKKTTFRMTCRQFIEKQSERPAIYLITCIWIFITRFAQAINTFQIQFNCTISLFLKYE